jgi:hypothetical protein
MSPVVVVNAEAAVRDWLLTRPAVTAIVQNAIFIGVPAEISRREGAYPLVGVHRLFSTVGAYLPVDDAALQLDCWGPMKSQKAASAAASAIASELWSLVPNTALTADVVAKGVHDLATVWGPDPVSDRPRYIVTATVTLLAVTP